MAVTMLLGTNTITANAQTISSGSMEVAEDGRIKISCDTHADGFEDASGRIWRHTSQGYPFCYYDEETERVQKPWGVAIRYTRYLDCYLTDYIKSHDESEWPSFVIKGSDGVPFYYEYNAPDGRNYDEADGFLAWYYVRYCYDEKTGFWVWDKSYKGPYEEADWLWSIPYKTVKIEDLDLYEQLRKRHGAGETYSHRRERTARHKDGQLLHHGQ